MCIAIVSDSDKFISPTYTLARQGQQVCIFLTPPQIAVHSPPHKTDFCENYINTGISLFITNWSNEVAVYASGVRGVA